MKKVLFVLVLVFLSSAILEDWRWLENGKLKQWHCSGNNCVEIE